MTAQVAAQATVVPLQHEAGRGRAAWRPALPAATFALGAGVYLLLTALAFFVVRPTTLLYFTDYWEHRAIVEEVIRHGTQLRDPIYGEAAPSRQFTPWSLLLGYLARIAHLDPDTAMAWGAMLVSALFVAGVHDFARSWYAHRWAPALLLGALTCGWGVPPLIWTGFYALRSQLHGNYYPAALVFSLSFVAWAGVVRLLRAERFGRWDALLVGGSVACSFVTHPLNAAFLVAGAAALAALEPGIAMRRRAGVALVLVAGVLATTLWPWFDPLSLAGAGIARGQQTSNNYGFFFAPGFVVALVWPALVVVPALPASLRDPRARMPAVALLAIFAAYVAGGLADVSVSHRFLAYVVLALHLLFVRIAVDAIDGRPPPPLAGLSPRGRRIAMAGAAMLVLAQGALAAEQLIHPWARTHYPYPVRPVDAEVRRVREALPADARLLGWDSAALVMPAHGVLVAAFPRPMPLSPTDARRQAGYRRFFAPGVPACERRAITRRLGATHVAWLANELDPQVQRELRRLGPVASPAGSWRIMAAPPLCRHVDV